MTTAEKCLLVLLLIFLTATPTSHWGEAARIVLSSVVGVLFINLPSRDKEPQL